MKTSVIVEKPLFTLQSYNDHGEEVTINLFADDFRSAEIGKKWEAYTNSSRSAESLEVVYKTASGVAVRYQNFSTDWEEREDDPELIWIELHYVEEDEAITTNEVKEQ